MEDCCRKRAVSRSQEEKKRLKNRISRMIGQLNGIANMVEDDRYCGEILIQVAAVSSALSSFGDRVLEEHMKTCVIEEIRVGNHDIMDELMELIGKFH